MHRGVPDVPCLINYATEKASIVFYCFIHSINSFWTIGTEYVTGTELKCGEQNSGSHQEATKRTSNFSSELRKIEKSSVKRQAFRSLSQLRLWRSQSCSLFLSLVIHCSRTKHRGAGTSRPARPLLSWRGRWWERERARVGRWRQARGEEALSVRLHLRSSWCHRRCSPPPRVWWPTALRQSASHIFFLLSFFCSCATRYVTRGRGGISSSRLK